MEKITSLSITSPIPYKEKAEKKKGKKRGNNKPKVLVIVGRKSSLKC